MTTRRMQLSPGIRAKGNFFCLPSELRQHILYYASTSEMIMGDAVSPLTRLGRIIYLSSSVAEDMVKVVPRLTEKLAWDIDDLERHEALLRDAGGNGCCDVCDECLRLALELYDVTKDQLINAVEFLLGLETTLKKMAEAREVRIPSRKRKRMSCP